MGNNSINDLLSSLQYLRSFGNLRILNMQGNPCSRDPDYHTRVIAHLAQVRSSLELHPYVYACMRASMHIGIYVYEHASVIACMYAAYIYVFVHG